MPGPLLPFLGFIRDGASLDAARSICEREGWKNAVYEGSISEAIDYLREHAQPHYLLVEISSADEAPALLDKLAEVCRPEVHVIVAGKSDAYSFYMWLKEIGIHGYLLEPFTPEALEALIHAPQATEAPAQAPGESSRIVAFMGTRGGVGTTTIASNLANIIAGEKGIKTALLDLDAHFGTMAMAFDIEPGRGLKDALEKPARIDGLFLDRVMVKYHPNLAILSAEESLATAIPHTPQGITALLEELKRQHRAILIDLPRFISPMTRAALEQADDIVLITEPTLLSLRDLMRQHDFIAGELKKQPPVVVANREGLASKFEIKRNDLAKHYGHPIAFHMPCMMEAFSATAAGEMLVETRKNSAGLAVLHALADHLFSDDAAATETEKKGFFRKRK